MRKIVSLIFGSHSDTRRLTRFESDSSVAKLKEENDCASESLEKIFVDDPEFTTEESDITLAEQSATKTSLLNHGQEIYNEALDHSSASEYFNINYGGIYIEKATPASNVENAAWCVLLRSRCSNLKGRGKFWRPILIKLEEASLKFHAQGFETSSPFKVIPLLWSYAFNTPKYRGSFGENTVLVTSLLNTSLGSSQHRRFLKYPILSEKSRLRVAKVGCVDRKVLLDFMETVQRCVSSFPGFRQRGIRYRKDRVFVDIQDVYEVVQMRRGKEIKATCEVRVKVKALVSGSPECRIILNSSGSFDRKISFHKCVLGKDLRNPVVVTFIPLDNCWFQLINLKSITHKPPPLRCEVTVTVRNGNWFELQAQIFHTMPGPASLDAAPVRNINLRFHVPLLLLQSSKVSEPDVVKNTSVSKGEVVYSLSSETMVWSLHRLPLKTYKNDDKTESPLASLNCNFCPATSLNSESFTKVPVEMDYVMNGNTVALETDISGMYFGLRKFDNFKTQHSRQFRIVIPVVCVKQLM